jgi:hypothetical protein
MATQAEARLHNSEAEVAVLGAILLEPATLPIVHGKLSASDFYSPRNGLIFQGILALCERGQPVDLVTLSEELRMRGALDQCGGATYLSGLTSAVPSSANVEYYADIVRETAAKRRLLRLADTLKEQLTSPGADAASIAGKMSAEFSQDAKSVLAPRILQVADILAYPEIEYVVEQFAPVGALVNLTAYTGIGKSVWTSSLSLSAMSGLPFLGKYKVYKPGPVLYFDAETPCSYWRDRARKMRFREDDPFYLGHFTGLKLDDDRNFDAIVELVMRYAPVLVSFDTLIRFHNRDENSSTEMALVMERLRKIANMGPCVMVQIHQNKGQGDLRIRSRGASDIIGACDLELSLTPAEHGLLHLQSVKARMAPIERITLKIEEVDGELRIVLAEDWNQEIVEAADELLRESKTGLSVTALWKALEAEGVGVSRSTVVRMIAARDSELIYEEGPRKTKLYHLRGAE